MQADKEPRRTQLERRAATRRALLDATFECLVELGFARTTTTEVTRRAGVSVGALLHHFPSKTDLLAAAIRDVLGKRHEEFRTSMATLDPGVDRVSAAIDLLWSQYSGPTFTAWVELWVAARTDPELAAVIVEVDEDFVRASQDLFADLFPPAEYPQAALMGLPFAFAVMDGVALLRLVPHNNDGQTALDTLKAVAALLLQGEPSDRRVR